MECKHENNKSNSHYFGNQFSRQLRLAILTFVWITMLSPANVFANAPIGNVLVIKGLVQSESEGGDKSILAKGDDVYQKDTILTDIDGFIVLKMSDGMKLTLRPDSELILHDFNAEPGSESVAIELLKGGLRTISGIIGKTNPEAFELRTPVATIGIRGTEFSLRLCKSAPGAPACSSQCAVEEAQLSSISRKSSTPESINGVAITGTLTQCEPLDEISDGAYLVLYGGGVNMSSEEDGLEFSGFTAARVEENSSPKCLIDVPNFMLMDPILGI
jgi:hypothetical protein